MDHPVLNFLGQIAKRHIGLDTIALGRAHHVPLAFGPGLRLPRLHHAVRDGQRHVRQRQAVVDRNDPAKAAAVRAGTDRVVETEQRRRRVAVLNIARRAVKLATKPLRPQRTRVNSEVALAKLIRLLDRLEKPGAASLGQAHAILHHRHHLKLPLGQALGRLINAQHFRQDSATRFHRRVKDTLVALFSDKLQRFLEGDFFSQRNIERNENFVRLTGADCLPNGQWLVTCDNCTAPVTVTLGEVRPQVFHVVADLGHRADGRAGGANGVALAKRDGGRDAVDSVNLRLVHPIEKLPDIRRKRLDITPLPLSEEGVKCERTFAGTAQAGEDDQPALGQVEIEILEVIVADTTQPNHVAGRLARHAVGVDAQPLAMQSLR